MVTFFQLVEAIPLFLSLLSAAILFICRRSISGVTIVFTNYYCDFLIYGYQTKEEKNCKSVHGHIIKNEDFVKSYDKAPLYIYKVLIL